MNLKKTIFILLMASFVLLSLQSRVYSSSEEFFTIEAGSVAQFRDLKFSYKPLEVTNIGYRKNKEEFYLHIFWGSLEGEYDHRTQYIFGELGYEREFNKDYYWSFSYGIGRILDREEANPHFTSNNMFTQAITFGYENYYIAIRHMSNGQEILGNPPPNYGRETITFGIRF